VGAGEEITAAWDAWRDAKRAYDDEAAPYVGVTWLPTVPSLRPSVERLTRQAFEKLMRLGEAEHEAVAAFYAVLDENRQDVSSDSSAATRYSAAGSSVAAHERATPAHQWGRPA
jgi:hypothetical protein